MEDNKNEIVSRNEVLLKNLKGIVLKNLENEQFGVLQLAKESNYSRSQLYRKIKLLTSKSINEYIRDIRLEEALKLLVNDVATISEIAYKVGFTSPTYFSRCFHERYGYSPIEIKNKVEDEGKDIVLSTLGSLSEEKNKKNLVVFWSLAFIIPVVILVAYLFGFNSRIDSSPNTMSLAVLPLENLSNDEDSMLLTEGMHDAIIGALGQLSALRVISRTSTLKYSDVHPSMNTIAEELDVKLVIEGSVYFYGDSARIQLQLIKPFPKEEHLWAGDYYINIKDVLNIQSTLVQEIAAEINVNITPQEKKQLSTPRTLNIETYKPYLRGMYFINKHSTKEFMKGMEFLKEAVEKDPANALAYAGLATGYAQMGHGPDPEARFKALAKAAASRAISLDSTIPEPYVVLGMIKGYYEFEWDEALRLFRKANKMNNSIAMSHFQYAWHLAILGRYEEALKEHLLAKQLAPLELIYTADLGSLYYWMNRSDDAINEEKQALKQDNNFVWAWWVLGEAYAQKGMLDKAIEAHKKAVSLDSVWKWTLGNTYALAGETKKANEILNELKLGEIMPRTALGITFINISLENMDEAYKWVELAKGDPWVAALGTWPGLEKFRQDPRFKQFLIDKNLPPVKPYLETVNGQ